MTDHEGSPASLGVAPLVGDLESRLVRAEALAHAGRIAESTSIASEVVVEAEALDQPRLVVEALLVQARASATGSLLGRAQQISIARGLDVPAAEAMIRRLGLASGGSEIALADVPIAEAMLVRAGDDPELRALLLDHVGALHAAAGDREAAREAFEQALAIEQRLFGDRHLEFAVGLAKLGMLTPDSATRSALHQRMIDIYERRLGPEHPRTLDARLLAAFHTEDPELAAATLARLCPRFRAIGELRFAGECELERGRVELGRGRLDVARGAFELAHEQLRQQVARRVLLDAYLRIGSDADVDAEIVGLRELIAKVDEQARGEGWWVRLEQAERRSVLGRLVLQAGAPTAAVVEIERAIVDLDAIRDHAPPIERDRLLAGARATLALARAESDSTPKP
jgi:tetratricopeptide (TPR) repeat protein